MSKRRTPRPAPPIRQPVEAGGPSFRLDRLDFTLLAGLLLLTTAVFVRMLGFESVSIDRFVYGSDNPRLVQGLSLDAVEWAFSNDYNYWQPLAYISHMADFQFFGQHLAGHYAVNLFWHLTNAALLYRVVPLCDRRALEKRRRCRPVRHSSVARGARCLAGFPQGCAQHIFSVPHHHRLFFLVEEALVDSIRVHTRSILAGPDDQAYFGGRALSCSVWTGGRFEEFAQSIVHFPWSLKRSPFS